MFIFQNSFKFRNPFKNSIHSNFDFCSKVEIRSNFESRSKIKIHSNFNFRSQNIKFTKNLKFHSNLIILKFLKTNRNRKTVKRKTKNKKSEKKERKLGRPIHHAWVCSGWAAPTIVVHRRRGGRSDMTDNSVFVFRSISMSSKNKDRNILTSFTTRQILVPKNSVSGSVMTEQCALCCLHKT
jgi:hypothetical protein